MPNCIRIDIFKLLFKLQGKNMNFKSTFILLQLSLTLLSAEVSPGYVIFTPGAGGPGGGG